MTKECHTPTLTQILNHCFMMFLGSFAIKGNVAEIAHLLHGCTPTNTCPIKNFNTWCLRYVAFECNMNFHINWESFGHKEQPKNNKIYLLLLHIKCLGFDAPKLRKWRMSSFGSWTGSTINRLKAHSCIEINQKIANALYSNLSTWHKHNSVHCWVWTSSW